MSPRAVAKPVDDSDEDEEGVRARDFVMARLAAGRAAAQAAINEMDEALALFVDPDEDKAGKERTEAIEAALESLGVACRALEAAEEEIEDVDMEAGEPWEEDE